MKFLKGLQEKKKQDFMQHVSEKIQKRVESGLPMCEEEYRELRANSYERKLLMPLLTISALFAHIDYCYSQSTFHPKGQYKLPKSYDDAITEELLPLLLKKWYGIIGTKTENVDQIPVESGPQ